MFDGNGLVFTPGPDPVPGEHPILLHHTCASARPRSQELSHCSAGAKMNLDQLGGTSVCDFHTEIGLLVVVVLALVAFPL